MRIGVTVPMSVSDGPGRISSWAEILAFARHAKAIGLDSVWVCCSMRSLPYRSIANLAPAAFASISIGITVYNRLPL